MQNEFIQIDRAEVEQTILDLQQSKAVLERESAALIDRIKATANRIEALQQKLCQPARANGKKPRLHKGEGIAAILKVLNGPDGLGMSQVQIAEKTNISPSTVSRILSKNTDKVTEGADHMFRKKTG
jgi:DNA-directed RNA polymerase specialized sigma subunit